MSNQLYDIVKYFAATCTWKDTQRVQVLPRRFVRYHGIRLKTASVVPKQTGQRHVGVEGKGVSFRRVVCCGS